MANILLVDDDRDFVDATTMVLEAEGFTVTPAFSAKQAWDALHQTTPDVMLLDCMMEDFDSGFDLSRDIAIKFPNVPVIMLTCVRDYMSDKWKFSREEDKKWLPVSHFLEKPVSPEVLVTTVRQVLAEKQK
ncbi:MAG TPA: response regulator [Acidobacteriota bacterium]|nr:response regulator [Acidobacteriota bacterium]HQF86782.1 response regulator [Acidobacteriota bacterium]HQG91420.1 response regulator [Acidobacteriota bacterium]